MIEHIVQGEKTLSIIIRTEFKKDGIEFFTDDNFTQQIGYMNRPQDYIIKPHVHNIVAREVEYTKEVLFIKSGLVRADFYDDQQNYLESRLLRKGDVVLLAFGGHGFKMIEPSEIIEVKQGPYCGETDKTRFEPIDDTQVIMKG